MLGVGFVTALAAVLVLIRFEPWWQRAPYLALVVVLVALSRIDAAVHLLPNRIVWPSIAVALVVVGAGSLLGAGPMLGALVGAMVFAGVIGGIHLAYPQGMGRGDVKLAVLLGLAIGWPQSSALAAGLLVVHALVASSGVGLAYAALAGAWRRREVGTVEVPFGPALAAGSLLVIVASPLLVG